MKLFLIGALLLGTLCCTAQSSVTPPLKDLAWLAGEWKRLNTGAGQSGSEKWEIISDMEMKGLGITMKGSDTAFVEQLRLVVKDHAVYYVADVAENGKPVFFKLTTLEANVFICENAQHDFPKMIVYRKEGTTLKATISGNGKSIVYLFEKL